MTYRMAVTLCELEGHFWCYSWQNTLHGPFASAVLLVVNNCNILYLDFVVAV